MSYSDRLIEQARQLIAVDPRRPRQAKPPCAVSSAYYAVFHEIIDQAVTGFMGGAAADDELGHRVRRAFDHKKILHASKWFAARRDVDMPESLRFLFEAIPADLRRFCEALADLQEERHRADYDLWRDFARPEAQRLVDAAEGAMEAIRHVRGEKATIAFLWACLLGDSVRSRA